MVYHKQFYSFAARCCKSLIDMEKAIRPKHFQNDTRNSNNYVAKYAQCAKSKKKEPKDIWLPTETWKKRLPEQQKIYLGGMKVLKNSNELQPSKTSRINLQETEHS